MPEGFRKLWVIGTGNSRHVPVYFIIAKALHLHNVGDLPQHKLGNQPFRPGIVRVIPYLDLCLRVILVMCFYTALQIGRDRIQRGVNEFAIVFFFLLMSAAGNQ